MNRPSKNLMAYVCINNLSLKRATWFYKPRHFWGDILKVYKENIRYYYNKNSITILKDFIETGYLSYRIDTALRWFRNHDK